MLHMLFRLLEFVKKWDFEFEHDVDFVQRINREQLEQEKSSKNC